METKLSEGFLNQDTLGRVAVKFGQWVESTEFKQATLGVEQGVIDRFAKGPCLTTIPSRVTLESLRKSGAITFQDPLQIFDPTEQKRLNMEPTTATDVIYFPGIIPGSYTGAFDKEEVERVNRRFPPSTPQIQEDRLQHHAQAMVDRLPKVPGVRWAIPSSAMLAVILGNHQKKTGELLLLDQFAWTSDTYDSTKYKLSHLLLGSDSKEDAYYISHLVSGFQRGTAAVFVAGLPE